MLDHPSWLLASVGLFLWGVLRRFFLWLPPLVLDRADALGVYAQYRSRLPLPVVGTVDWVIGHALIGFGMLLAWAAVLTYHELRITSGHRIAALKRELTLGVEIPMPLQLMRPSADSPEMSGWMLFLQNVRITNRSKTSSVSLGMTIHVRLRENPRALQRLSVREDNDMGFGKTLPAGMPQYLRTPLNIVPEQTVMGMLGFWVGPWVEHEMGIDSIDKVIARRGDSIYGTRDAELEIIDYVSGEILTVPISSEHPRASLSVRRG